MSWRRVSVLAASLSILAHGVLFDTLRGEWAGEVGGERPKALQVHEFVAAAPLVPIHAPSSEARDLPARRAAKTAPLPEKAVRSGAGDTPIAASPIKPATGDAPSPAFALRAFSTFEQVVAYRVALLASTPWPNGNALTGQASLRLQLDAQGRLTAIEMMRLEGEHFRSAALAWATQAVAATPYPWPGREMQVDITLLSPLAQLLR